MAACSPLWAAEPDADEPEDFPFPTLQQELRNALSSCADPYTWPVVQRPAPSQTRERRLWDARKSYTPLHWEFNASAQGLCARPLTHPLETPLPFAPPDGTAAVTSTTATLKVADGWLYGRLMHYFGGGLYWADAQGGQTRRLVDEPALGLLHQPQGGVLALTGFAHLGSGEGGLWKLHKADAGWQVERLIRWPERPCAWTQARDGTLFVSFPTRLVVGPPQGPFRMLWEGDEGMGCRLRQLHLDEGRQTLWWSAGPYVGALDLQNLALRHHLRSVALLQAYSPAWERAVLREAHNPAHEHHP